MPSPFPGMDPYLENPAFWPDFHASFITYWRDALTELLPDNYEARIDERVNPLAIEEETRETYIEILHRPDRTLVAVLEFLSPSNKEEPGRSVYLSKRNVLLYHDIHLVELDFLLKGQRLPLEKDYPPGDYFALIARGDHRPDCNVYHWPMRQPLPTIPIPLRAPDPDIFIDLAAVFAITYEKGRYARSVDYTKPPPIALGEADLQWVVERTGGASSSPKNG